MPIFISHGRGSLRLNVCEFDYLCPFLGFVSDELAECDRRHRHRFDAEGEKAPLQIGIADAGDNLSGSAAALAARCKNCLRGSFMVMPPGLSTFRSTISQIGHTSCAERCLLSEVKRTFWGVLFGYNERHNS